MFGQTTPSEEKINIEEFANNVKAERGKDFDSERREVYKYVSARF